MKSVGSRRSWGDGRAAIAGDIAAESCGGGGHLGAGGGSDDGCRSAGTEPGEDVGRAGIAGAVVGGAIHAGRAAVFRNRPHYHRAARHRNRSAEMVTRSGVAGFQIEPGDPLSSH